MSLADNRPGFLSHSPLIRCVPCRRAKLRKHHDVIEELQRWWEACQHSLQSGEDRAAHRLSREEYILLSRKLSRAMLPEWDETEVQQLAEEARRPRPFHLRSLPAS